MKKKVVKVKKKEKKVEIKAKKKFEMPVKLAKPKKVEKKEVPVTVLKDLIISMDNGNIYKVPVDAIKEVLNRKGLSTLGAIDVKKAVTWNDIKASAVSIKTGKEDNIAWETAKIDFV